MLEKIEFHHLAFLVIIIAILAITIMSVVSMNKNAEVDKFAIEHGCQRVPTPNTIGQSHWDNCKISNTEGK